VLDRQVTGAQEWINSSAEAALADGYDLRPAAPVGRFRARPVRSTPISAIRRDDRPCGRAQAARKLADAHP
jgi:hypothetical protein